MGPQRTDPDSSPTRAQPSEDLDHRNAYDLASASADGVVPSLASGAQHRPRRGHRLSRRSPASPSGATSYCSGTGSTHTAAPWPAVGRRFTPDCRSNGFRPTRRNSIRWSTSGVTSRVTGWPTTDCANSTTSRNALNGKLKAPGATNRCFGPSFMPPDCPLNRINEIFH